LHRAAPLQEHCVPYPFCYRFGIMAKPKRRYVCQACGSEASRWQGQCEDCGEWNTLVEEAGATVFEMKHHLRSGGRMVELAGLDSDIALPQRSSTGIAEFDRALGGGLVPGSATLLGGDPGIGKSTLLLQAAANLARRGLSVAYISGEEPWIRCGCVRGAWGWATRRCSSLRQPRCAIY
jgi:DNA repair protein RadA/Sms